MSDDVTKQCTKCGETKPYDAFYARCDGKRTTACIECTKHAVQTNYRSRRSYYVDYDRRREQTESRKAFKSRHRRHTGNETLRSTARGTL